jgi:hypothetical protein
MLRLLASLCLLTCLVSTALAGPTHQRAHVVVKGKTSAHRRSSRGYSASRPRNYRSVRSQALHTTKTAAVKPAMPLPITEEPLLVEISHQQTQAATIIPPPFPAPESHGFWFHRRQQTQALSIPLFKQSWIMPLSNSDAAQLGAMIAETVHSKFPKAQTLYLRPSAQDSPLATCLKYRLNTLGHKVSDVEDGSIAIRYRVSRLHQGVLVSLKLPGQQIARLYQRSASGTLVAGSAVSSLQEP